jgi:hypothetical protein
MSLGGWKLKHAVIALGLLGVFIVLRAHAISTVGAGMLWCPWRVA